MVFKSAAGCQFFTFVDDFSIGGLSPGTHALRIVADVFNEVAESNEFDNEYTRFVNIISGQPNLAPFQPGGWSDRIVVSNVTGTHSDSGSLSPTHTLFVDWAAINNGTVPVSAVFHTRLFVDGIERGNWFTNPPLGTSSVTFVDDFSIGSLSAGTHTLRIVVDVFNEIAESNEFDNEYTKFISVTLPGQPNMTPFQPSGWSDKIVVSNVTGTHSDTSSLRSTDTLFVDWAAINNGNTPVSVVFHAKLFVDGIEKGGWFSNPPLGVGSFALVDDFSIGRLSAGTHTLRIVADALNEVAESNEFDNEYSRTINVTSQQCFTLTVNVSPNDGGSVGRNPQSTCPGLLIVQEPDFVPQTASDMPAGIASPSGLSRTDAAAQAFKVLISKAEAEGPVLVIVELRGPHQAEGTLTREAVQLQRSTIAQAQERLLNRMSTTGLRNIKRFKSIPFIAFEVDADGLKFLEASPDVSSIGEDKLFRAALSESVSIVGAPNAWAAGFTGAGQAVAILDTGVDKNHPFLVGKIVSEACYSSTSSVSLSVCPGGVSNSTSPGSGVNCTLPACAHGTHVAGIAAGKGSGLSGVAFSGVARDANVIAIQIFSRFTNQAICDDEPAPCLRSMTSDQMLGLERVGELDGSFNIASVNMSLGGGEFRSTCDSANLDTIALTELIDNLRLRGIATIISAGNDHLVDALGSPACISRAISVGSTGDGSIGLDGIAQRDAVSDFSNSAPFLNLLAPGKWILSSVPGGLFSNFRGTSMAAPHVAGAWAILKSKSPTASVDQILAALTSTGMPVTDARNGIVKPRIQVDAALNALGGGGGGSVSQYSSGTTVTLTASPNAGFAFVKWQREGVDFSTSATVNVQMGSDHAMTAVFRASSSATTITSLVFNGTKKLSIAGSGFGLSPRVLINNVDRSNFITGLTDLSISLKAKKKKLGLRPGDNTVQVLGTDGAASNIAVLRL